MKMATKILILIIICACLSAVGLVWAQETGPLPAGETGGNTAEIEKLNQEIQSRKNKIKELEDAISQYKQEITKKQTEAASLKNQLAILDNHLAQARSDIELTETKIDKTQLEIDALSLVIADKEAGIERQKSMIKTIIQNLHADDQKNYLEIVLTNNDFAEFYNQVKYLENVYTDLGRSVKTLRLAKDDLDKKHTELSNQKNNYQALRTELINKRTDLTEQNNYKSNLLTQTKSSEARYQTMVANLQKQYQAIENEIRAYENQIRRKLEADKDPQFESLTAGQMSWPVPSHYVTAAFHDIDYPYRNVFEHSGLDIRATQGTAVRAANSGYVGRAKRCSLSSCYSYVLLIHTDDLSTVYGHLSGIAVNEDDFVRQGDIIGYSGGTPGTAGAGPFVTGPHLHFEVRKNGIPVNPAPYLSD